MKQKSLSAEICYLRCHESIWWQLSRPGQSSHSGAGDEVKILLPVRIKECHCLGLHIIGSNFEWNDLQLGQARSHAKHLSTVGRLIDIPLGRVRVWHALHHVNCQ